MMGAVEMAGKTQRVPYKETISDVFRVLVDRSGKTPIQISEETKIPLQSIYSLYNRQSTRADIQNLKILADYFGEELTVFCGLKNYHPIRKLTPEQEQILQQYDTLTDDAKLQVLGLLNRLHRDPENVARLI